MDRYPLTFETEAEYRAWVAKGTAPEPRGTEFARRFFDGMRKYVGHAVGIVAQRVEHLERRCESADQLIADLERRLAELEARK